MHASGKQHLGPFRAGRGGTCACRPDAKSPAVWAATMWHLVHPRHTPSESLWSMNQHLPPQLTFRFIKSSASLMRSSRVDKSTSDMFRALLPMVP